LPLAELTSLPSPGIADIEGQLRKAAQVIQCILHGFSISLGDIPLRGRMP